MISCAVSHDASACIILYVLYNYVLYFMTYDVHKLTSIQVVHIGIAIRISDTGKCQIEIFNMHECLFGMYASHTQQKVIDKIVHDQRKGTRMDAIGNALSRLECMHYCK